MPLKSIKKRLQHKAQKNIPTKQAVIPPVKTHNTPSQLFVGIITLVLVAFMGTTLLGLKKYLHLDLYWENVNFVVCIFLTLLLIVSIILGKLKKFRWIWSIIIFEVLVILCLINGGINYQRNINAEQTYIRGRIDYGHYLPSYTPDKFDSIDTTANLSD